MPLTYSRPPTLWKTISMRWGLPVLRPVVVMSMTPPRLSASRMGWSSGAVVMVLPRSGPSCWRVSPQPKRTAPGDALSACVERDGSHLGDADMVAERITEAEIDAVGLFRRLLCELDALGTKLVVCLVSVICRKEEVPAGPALGQERADLVGCRRIHRGRPGPLEHDLAIGVPRDADGQEAHETEILIRVDFQAECADVEVDGLVLIEHVDLRDSEAAKHVVGSPVLRG